VCIFFTVYCLSVWNHAFHISLFIVSTGLLKLPTNIRFALHDIVFSNISGLSEKAIKAISFELLKVIPHNIQPCVSFYVHTDTVTNEEIDLQALVSLFSFQPLII
jgi:hypothetical protein